MSMRMEKKKCPKCGKKYSWNPDLGQLICPYCAGTGLPLKTPKRNK